MYLYSSLRSCGGLPRFSSVFTYVFIFALLLSLFVGSALSFFYVQHSMCLGSFVFRGARDAATPAAVVRDGGGRGERPSGDNQRLGQGGEQQIA